MREDIAVVLAKEGSEEGFRRLYEMHREMVYRLAFRYVRSGQDAEDIMQETFIKAFRSIQRFSYERTSSFSAWLCRICINSVIGHLRKQKSRRMDRTVPLGEIGTEPSSDCQSPEHVAETGQVLTLIRRAAGKLSPQQRIAFDLRYSKQLEIAKIAEMMGSSESTVKTHVSRALAKLRKELRPIWE
jgi:RNA polymerase sigma-70 factor (ECF subfamily)